MNQLCTLLLLFGALLSTYVCEGLKASNFYGINSPAQYTCNGVQHTKDLSSKLVKRFRYLSDETDIPTGPCNITFNDVQVDTHHSVGLNTSWIVEPVVRGRHVVMNRFYIALTTKEESEPEHPQVFKMKFKRARKNRGNSAVIDQSQFNQYSWNVCNYIVPGGKYHVDVYGRTNDGGRGDMKMQTWYPLICRHDFTVPDCCSEEGRKFSVCADKQSQCADNGAGQ